MTRGGDAELKRLRAICLAFPGAEEKTSHGEQAFHVRGKDAFAGHIVDEGFVPPPEITVTHLIESDNIVVAEGSVRTRRTDGTTLNLAFCDVFEMHRGKIRKLISYLMETK